MQIMEESGKSNILELSGNLTVNMPNWKMQVNIKSGKVLQRMPNKTAQLEIAGKTRAFTVTGWRIGDGANQ